MVAAQDPDPGALADAAGAQRDSKRVRAGVKFGEREAAALVDQSDLVAVTDGGDGDRPAELTEPVQRAEHGEGAAGRVSCRSCRRATRRTAPVPRRRRGGRAAETSEVPVKGWPWRGTLARYLSID